MAKHVSRKCLIACLVIVLSAYGGQCGSSVSRTPKDLSQLPNLLLLVSMPGFSSRPSWSPDGTEIAFDYGIEPYGKSESLYRVPFPEGVPVQVLQVEKGAAVENGGWDPRGEWIALGEYNALASGIYIVRPTGEDLTQLAAERATPIWSRDGQKLAFQSDNLYIVQRDGTATTQLLAPSDQSEMCAYLAWSPDGTKLACASPRSGNWEIYAINVDGSGATNLTRSMFRDLDPSWSPDGSKIAFVSDRIEPIGIYVMNSDGSGCVRITGNEASDFAEDPDWSPTGKQISLRGHYGRLEVMNADGSDRRTLVDTSDCRIGERDWSPDGQWIVFSCAYGGDVAYASWVYAVRVNP